MALLGDDGKGYDLARKLESSGVWRTWLGDSHYSTFLHFLSSVSSWDSFMSSDESKSRAQIQLQLRVRALLFDKAYVSLFLRSEASSSGAVSKLNPSYLQLRGDDIYFSLENYSQEGVQQREVVGSRASSSSKIQPKTVFGGGSRYGESEIDSSSHRYPQEEFPETWHSQFIQTHRLPRPCKLSFTDRESDKRTSEQMATYCKFIEKHKRRRAPFKEDQPMNIPNPIFENGSNIHQNSITEDDTPFFPETMFTFNSVPESSFPSVATRAEENRKVEFYGVFDTLPHVMTKSSIMIERGLYRGRNGSEKRRELSEEQASKMAHKVVVRVMANVGFEGGTELPTDVLSQLLSGHVSKLGRILKVLADNYRKQCSAVELIKMFLQTAGYSNLGPLAELVKDGSRNFVQQPQLQLQGNQSQLQQQHQIPMRHPQQLQIPRQMHPQMQQMVNPQNIALQQHEQWERMRRRQQSTARPVMTMDKERSMVEVKIEAPSEMPIDSNTFPSINTARQPHMQFRQQQMAAISNLHPQPPFRQLSPLQIPSIQSPNTTLVRAPPVKVEGFQELMGGDSTSKHDAEENKLTSPSK